MANSVPESNEAELFDHAFLIHTDRCDTMAMNYSFWEQNPLSHFTLMKGSYLTILQSMFLGP